MAYIGKSPSGTGVRSRFFYTQSSAGATSISGNDDDNRTLTFSDAEYVDVYLNGSLLAKGDYTAASNTISGLAALASGDIVEVVVYDIFTVADTVSAKDGGTFSGNVGMQGLTATTGSFSGDLTVDTTTLKVDSTNNRVGVGTSAPDNLFTILGGDSGHSWSYDSGDLLIVEDNDSASINIATPAANSGNILFSDADARGQGRIAYTHSSDKMEFMTGGVSNTRMTIDSSGNVGIGSQPYQGRLWIDGGDIWLRGNNSNRSINFTTDNSTDSTPNTGIRAVKGSGTQGILETICWDGSGSLFNIFKAVGNTNAIAGGTAGRSVAFAHAGVAIDRTWGNYPGFTVMGTSDSGQTNQGEFRIHGANTRYSDYPAAHGADFGVNLRIDGTSFLSNSDRRSKTNIVDNPHGLDEILQLTPRKFDRVKADGTIQPHLTNVLGFVAQEVEPILPEAVIHYADEDDGTDGYNTAYSISDGPIVSTLVNAVKEQQTIINGLISRIETLETKVAALEAAE